MKKPKSITWEDYMRASQSFRQMPKDPYSHATFLLTTDPKDTTEFNELLNRHVLLGNISNDRLMRLYQNDIHFLTAFFEMARRDKGFKIFFNVIFNIWVSEVALTRARDGMERRLQNFTGQILAEKSKGFGGGLFKKKQKTQEEMYREMLMGEPAYG